MNWAYIAGFFDGEGCLSLQTTRMNISLYQSGDIGRAVLSEMSEWLKGEDIESCLYHRKKFTLLSKKELWELRISSRRSQLLFLRGVLPYARVKRILIQDFIRYYTMFPPNRWWLLKPKVVVGY